jgi:tRNA-2-methylthio-N6-dimethylallyladenosine synthase
MIGFPGETEAEFENTLEWIRKTRYDSAYLFAYSPREGTKAAVMEDQIPHVEKIRRLEALIEHQNRITLEINASNIGRTFDVMVEGRSSKDANKWTGLTNQGKTMNFISNSDENLYGEIVSVKATESHLWGFAGEHEVLKLRSFDSSKLLQMATA